MGVSFEVFAVFFCVAFFFAMRILEVNRRMGSDGVL